MIRAYDKGGTRTVLDTDLSIAKLRQVLNLCLDEATPDDRFEVHVAVDSIGALEEMVIDSLRWGR